MRDFEFDGRTFTIPGEDGGASLVRIALTHTPTGPVWLEVLEAADLRSLIGAMGQMGRHDLVAYREAAAAMVQRRLAEDTVASMKDLERVATKLQWVAIFVGAISAMVSGAGVYVAWSAAR